MRAAGSTWSGRLVVALRSAGHRLRTLLGGAARAAEDEEELRFHLQQAEEELLARGLDPLAARREARRRFGGLDAIREASAEQRGAPWLDALLRDLRYALRALRHAPAFTATAVTVVALGIAGVCAIVPLLDAVLLEPLPYPRPERLVALFESNVERGWERASCSPANLLDFRDQLRSLDGVAAYGFTGGWALGGAGRAEWVRGVQVLGSFFTVLGVRPALGRDFAADEHWGGDEPTVVISDGLWRRRFGADPAVIGRRIQLDGAPRTVLGVAPPGFAFPQPGLDVWIPYGFDRSALAQEWFRRAHFVRGFGRLAPGRSLATAERELAALAERLGRRYPVTNTGYGAGLVPLRDWIVGEVRPRLVVLAAAVALLLLIACANVASLLYARAGSRAREVALRSALGASRGRLVRQLLSETLLLAAAGGLLGIAVGFAGSRLLVALAGDTLPRGEQVAIDASVVIAALLLVLLTGLLFGVAPGLRAAATPPSAALRGEGRAATTGREVLRNRGALMLAEVACAVVLLAGAGLAGRSFWGLLRVDPGFVAAGGLAVSYDLPSATYGEAAEVHSFHRRLLERLRGLPGVGAAELANGLPLEGPQWTADFIVAGRSPEEKGIELSRRIVSPGYFAAMGARWIAGPGFPASAAESGPPVVVVNETMAGFVSPGAPAAAVGQRVALDEDGDEAGPLWRTVVGVVADERLEGPAGRPWMEMFVPLGQEPLGAMSAGMALRSVTVVLRTGAAEPAALLPALRGAAAGLDPDVPLYDARTLEGMLAEATARERLLMVLLALFAGLATTLATVGVYGLVAFAVAHRRREIGIRVALGAGARQVVRAVVGRAALLCAGGLALGLVVALLAGRLMVTLLHGVDPADPPTLAAAAGALALATVLAAWLPARRAVRVDPLETLRAE